MRKDSGFYGVMIPFLFIWGVLGALVILVTIDLIFNLGLSK